METVILTLLSVTALGALVLGVVSVIMNNKLTNRLNSIERWIEELNLQYQRGDEDIYKDIEEVSSKVDSRVDKLNSNIQRELEDLYRNLEDRQRATEGNIRDYLASWRNSDEFNILLNKIKKKEFDSDLSKSY